MEVLNKPLAILDLDQTLIYASKDKVPEREHDFMVFKYHVYKRPYLDEFLNRLGRSFKIAIWSSAGNEYVNNVVDNLNLNVELEFIWGRNESILKVENDEELTLGIEEEQFYVKPLKKVKRRGYKIERILIIDDSPHKSKLNYGNAIYPKSYRGDINDNELLKLIEYLDSIKDELNFRKIEKRNWRNDYDQ